MGHRSPFFTAALVALLGATAVQAEDYHAHGATTVSARSRSAVQEEAVQVAHAANQNLPAAAVSMGALNSARERAHLRVEAVLAAHAPDQNVSAGSRVNSTVIPTLPNPAAVRLQAAGQLPSTN